MIYISTRYFILIYHDKQYLQYCLKKIKNKLKNYNLKLNKKTQIMNIKKGFTFLGYKFILKEKIIMKITNKTKQNNLKNIKEKKQYYKRKNITFQNYFCSINSYKK